MGNHSNPSQAAALGRETQISEADRFAANVLPVVRTIERSGATSLAAIGVWERLLARAQEGGVALGITFLDGTTIRAHQKAARAAKKRGQMRSAAGCEVWTKQMIRMLIFG